MRTNIEKGLSGGPAAGPHPIADWEKGESTGMFVALPALARVVAINGWAT